MTCFSVLGIAQSEKQIPRGRREVQIIRAVGGCHAAAGYPVGGHGQVIVLLQTPAGDSLPIDRHSVAGTADIKRRRAGRLHHGNQRPKSAGERITATGHRPAGVMLADGAADLISAAGARAAATGDFIPINRVGLGVQFGLRQQQASNNHARCSDVIFHFRLRQNVVAFSHAIFLKKIPPLRGLCSRPDQPDHDHCKKLRAQAQKG